MFGGPAVVIKMHKQVRIHPWPQVAALGLPFPLPLSLQTNKQAVAMPALQPEPARLALPIGHLPTGRR